MFSGGLLGIYHSVIQYPAESRVSVISFKQSRRSEGTTREGYEHDQANHFS